MMKAKINNTVYSGSTTEIQMSLKGGQSLTARLANDNNYIGGLQKNDDVFVQFQEGEARLLKT